MKYPYSYVNFLCSTQVILVSSAFIVTAFIVTAQNETIVQRCEFENGGVQQNLLCHNR